jgi:hypothetical protein
MPDLILEDSPERLEQFEDRFPGTPTATTADAAIDALQVSGRTGALFLDHDLGGEQDADPHGKNTGMEVVRWIVDNRPAIKRVYIHSMNMSAASEMERRLRGAGYVTERIPFHQLMGSQR